MDNFRRGSATLAACLLLAALAREGAAATWTIDVGGAQLAYAPASLVIDPGDSVTFVNRGGFHNVLADDASFRCAQGCDGAGGNGDPSDAVWSATITLSTPGSVGFHCEVHGLPGAGMFGTIIVAAPVAPPRTLDRVPAADASMLLILGAAMLGAALHFRRRHLR